MTFVEINGTSYAMKYGHAALKKFMHKYGLKRMVELGDLPNKLTVDDMPLFIRCGFDTGAKVQGEEPPFTTEQVEELLEENLWLETAALEAFAESVQRPAKSGEKAPEAAEIEAEKN